MKQWLLKSMTLPLLQQREIPTAHMPLHPNTHTLFVTLLWERRENGLVATANITDKRNVRRQNWCPRVPFSRWGRKKTNKKLLHLSSKSCPAHIYGSQWLRSPLSCLCIENKGSRKIKKKMCRNSSPSHWLTGESWAENRQPSKVIVLSHCCRAQIWCVTASSVFIVL